MKLLGDWNWYLPSWLEWLPHVAVVSEPEPVSEPVPEVPPIPAAEDSSNSNAKGPSPGPFALDWGTAARFRRAFPLSSGHAGS